MAARMNIFLVLGQAAGLLSQREDFQTLVTSLRANQLEKDYVTLVRDKLNEALRVAVVEPGVSPESPR
jgi:hypothetical protein